MQPNSQPADRAHHTAQHTPHSPAPKPRRSVAASPSRRAGRTEAASTEGQLIRLVARLSVAAKSDTARHTANRHLITGYLLALEAHHLLPTERLLIVRRVCDVLLDGDITLQDLRAMKPNDNDPTYLRAIALVRRSGTADIERLARELSTTPTQARGLIERMQADGVVHAPDLFGVRTLKIQAEVSHG